MVSFVNTSKYLFFEDILALLLTDVLLFLQEKDQKYIFAAVVSIWPRDVYFKWLIQLLTNCKNIQVLWYWLVDRHYPKPLRGPSILGFLPYHAFPDTQMLMLGMAGFFWTLVLFPLVGPYCTRCHHHS